MSGSSQGPGRDPDDLLPLWVAIILIAATIVGILAGVVAWGTGEVPGRATLTGGSVFGGAATLGILLVVTLRRKSR